MAEIITTVTEESITAIHLTSVSGKEAVICRSQFKRKQDRMHNLTSFGQI